MSRETLGQLAKNGAVWSLFIKKMFPSQWKLLSFVALRVVTCKTSELSMPPLFFSSSQKFCTSPRDCT